MPNRSRRLHFGRVISFVVDESPLWSWIAAFLAIIVVFGFLYTYLSPLGHGMVDANDVVQDVDFWRGLYFSVVTISSLGYGDVHPAGAAKALAGVQVLLGLGFIGVIIAKLTSKPLSHLVSRLFVSETKRQLNHFKILFDTRRSDLNALLEEVNHVYQQTPGQASSRTVDSDQVERTLKKSLDRLFESSSELHDYIQAEGIHRSYFLLAPTSSLLQLAEAIENAFFFLGQSIVSLPVESTPSILNNILTYTNRRAIDNVINMQRATCEMIVDGVRIDEPVREAFGRISNLCTNISGYLMPIREQPDQLIQAS